MPEIKRRITLGWAAFNKVDNVMRSPKASMQIKKKVFNEYVLPVMTYGSETWALTRWTHLQWHKGKWRELCWASPFATRDITPGSGSRQE